MKSRKKAPYQIETGLLATLGNLWAPVFSLFGFVLGRTRKKREKVTKLRISYLRHDIRVTIEYYSEEDELKSIEPGRSPSLWLRSDQFSLPITAPETITGLETDTEEGVLDPRFEIFSRLAELRREAATEQMPYSQQSERDFFKFLLLRPDTSRPYLFLLENGNLRALWRNSDGEQVGLQFRGGETVQYVIFARRADTSTVGRSAGRDLLSNIDRLLEAHDVDLLMRSKVTA